MSEIDFGTRFLKRTDGIQTQHVRQLIARLSALNHTLTMRFPGLLKSWNDERGFGFIEPTQGGQILFVHISDFPSGSGRPAVGQALTFEVEAQSSGKKKARSVHYLVRTKTTHKRGIEASAHWTVPRLLALPIFALVYGFVVWRWGFSPLVLLGYLGLSFVTFFVYAFDKSAATGGSRRVSEQTLHLLSLIGGWPGALLAQQLMRHKTSKQSFITVFWATVLLNMSALVAWHAGTLAILPLT